MQKYDFDAERNRRGKDQGKVIVICKDNDMDSTMFSSGSETPSIFEEVHLPRHFVCFAWFRGCKCVCINTFAVLNG
jgi:hypothetical protein